MRDFTDDWPERLRRDFRQVSLVALSYRPIRWRSRRTDVFESADLRLVLQRTVLDVRIRRSFLRECAEALVEWYADAGRPADDCASVVASLETLDSAGTVDLLVPLFWSPGPTMDLCIEVGGKAVVPLSRREASDVMSEGPFLRLMHEGFADRIIELPESDGRPDTSVWRHIGWCLTATDKYCLEHARTLSGLRRHGPVDQHIAAIKQWMIMNIVQTGCGVRHARDMVNARDKEVSEVLRRTDYARTRLLSARSKDIGVPCWDPYNPALNPILMHHSFVRRLMWLQRHEHDGSPPDQDVVLDAFLRVCTYWVSALGTISDDLNESEKVPMSHEGGEGSTRRLLGSCVSFGASWPILARTRVPLERTARVSMTQRIPMPPASLGLDESEYHPSAPGRTVLMMLKAVPYLLSEAFRWVFDFVFRLIGRPLLKSEIGAVAYPLTFGDAMSYHVEVTCEGRGAALIPRSAIIRVPRKDYGSRHLRERLTGSALSTLVGPRRLDVRRAFGRSTDDCGQRQHFYTTKTDAQWTDACVIGLPGGISRLDVQPQLLVRYGTTGPWSWAMVLASLTMFALSLAMVRLSMLEALDLNTFAGAVPFARFATVSVPLFFSIMLLVAVDHRASPVIARRVNFVSWTVLVSYVLASLAIAGWLTAAHPRSVWQGEYRMGDLGPVGTAWEALAAVAQRVFNTTELVLGKYWQSILWAVAISLGAAYFSWFLAWAVGIVSDYWHRLFGGD